MEITRVITLRASIKKEGIYSKHNLAEKIADTLKSLSVILDKPCWFDYRGKHNRNIIKDKEVVYALLENKWDKKHPQLGAVLKLTTWENKDDSDYYEFWWSAGTSASTIDAIPNSLRLELHTSSIGYEEYYPILNKVRECFESYWNVIKFDLLYQE